MSGNGQSNTGGGAQNPPPPASGSAQPTRPPGGGNWNGLPKSRGGVLKTILGGG